MGWGTVRTVATGVAVVQPLIKKMAGVGWSQDGEMEDRMVAWKGWLCGGGIVSAHGRERLM